MNYVAWEKNPSTISNPAFCGSLSQSSGKKQGSCILAFHPSLLGLNFRESSWARKDNIGLSSPIPSHLSFLWVSFPSSGTLVEMRERFWVLGQCLGCLSVGSQSPPAPFNLALLSPQVICYGKIMTVTRSYLISANSRVRPSGIQSCEFRMELILDMGQNEKIHPGREYSFTPQTWPLRSDIPSSPPSFQVLLWIKKSEFWKNNNKNVVWSCLSCVLHCHWQTLKRGKVVGEEILWVLSLPSFTQSLWKWLTIHPTFGMKCVSPAHVAFRLLVKTLLSHSSTAYTSPKAGWCY